MNTSEHDKRSIKKNVLLKHTFFEIMYIIDDDQHAKRIAVIPENEVKKMSALSWNDDVCFAIRRLCNSADEIVICSHVHCTILSTNDMKSARIERVLPFI